MRIKKLYMQVKRLFSTLLQLKGLLQGLGEVGQNSSIAHDEGNAGGLGGGLQISRLVAAESNNRQMFSSWTLLQPGDSGADVVARALEIHEDYHGAGLLSAFDQSGGV